MLRAVDTVVEVIAWSVAVFFVILLFAGPRVVAEDKAQTPATAQDNGAAPPAGEAVFKDNCGSCHTGSRRSR